MPEMYVSMLLNALKADSLIITPKTAKKLIELSALINVVLEEAVA
jgi:hypothetical protein